MPSGFGRDLLSGRTTGSRCDRRRRHDLPRRNREKLCRAAWSGRKATNWSARCGKAGSPNAWSDDDIQTRFRYNQAFLSVNAMVPSVFMLMLCLIPAIMSAIAVVREKETGSIANFRSTPITKFEFLLGKQLPYVAVAMVNFVFLLLMAIFVFGVPLKGPFLTLLIATIVYVSGDNRFRTIDLVLHPHAGRRGFRDRDPVHRAGREFFRGCSPRFRRCPAEQRFSA